MNSVGAHREHVCPTTRGVALLLFVPKVSQSVWNNGFQSKNLLMGTDVYCIPNDLMARFTVIHSL